MSVRNRDYMLTLYGRFWWKKNSKQPDPQTSEWTPASNKMALYVVVVCPEKRARGEMLTATEYLCLSSEVTDSGYCFHEAAE